VSPAFDLQLVRDSFTPGERVAGTVLVTEGGGSRTLDVTLGFHEKSPDYEEIPVSQTQALHTGDLQTGQSLAFALDLPEDALPGHRSEHGELYWELRAPAHRGRRANRARGGGHLRGRVRRRGLAAAAFSPAVAPAPHGDRPEPKADPEEGGGHDCTAERRALLIHQPHEGRDRHQPVQGEEQRRKKAAPPAVVSWPRRSELSAFGPHLQGDYDARAGASNDR
jgi:hypothetical protein